MSAYGRKHEESPCKRLSAFPWHEVSTTIRVVFELHWQVIRWKNTTERTHFFTCWQQSWIFFSLESEDVDRLSFGPLSYVKSFISFCYFPVCENGRRRSRHTARMAKYGTGRRTRHAVDRVGTTMYVTSDVGQHRPVFWEVRQLLSFGKW